MSQPDPVDPPAGSAPISRRRLPSTRVVLLGVTIGLVVLWTAPTIAGFVADLDLAGLDHPYLVVFGFVVFDAVIPIFPSESLLTTGANLAAQDGSAIVLWRLTLAGVLGAVVGDSLLYWLARTVGRPVMAERVEQARRDERVSRVMDTFEASAAALIVFGRFVPGVRFMVGATMGLTRHPYGRFLLWDTVGAVLWAGSTCLCSYLVASVIEDRPLVSIAVSVVVTTGLLALLYRPLKRNWDESGSADGTAATPTPG